MQDALSNAGKTYSSYWYLICNYSTYLILMQSAAKGPDTGEGEVGLIELTWRVWWNVFCRQKAVEQSAEGLNRKRNKAVVICWWDKIISKWKVGVFFLFGTCTIEFSGIGTMVLKVFLICSTQRGTYFSNSMVRWARSVWCSLWSIQLATYLDKTKTWITERHFSSWYSATA